jgi:hypothetical protein
MRATIPEEKSVASTCAPNGVHQFSGGDTEYVARTGQEAPSLHPGG